MIITVSSPEQIDQLLASGCGQSFSIEAKRPGRFKPEIWKKNWLNFIKLDIGRIWMLDLGGKICGCIGGLVYPDIGDDLPSCSENFWYVLPEHRGGMGAMRLLKSLEAWAKERGVIEHFMYRHVESMDERIEDFYKSLDYKLCQKVFVKELNAL